MTINLTPNASLKVAVERMLPANWIGLTKPLKPRWP